MNNKKTLNQLFPIKFIDENGLDNKLIIEQISSDSRKVGFNTLFLATKGALINGNQFIVDAIESGACLVLSETKFCKDLHLNTPIIFVPKLKDILLDLFCRFYDYEVSNKQFIAITGTNGKTSVAHLFAQITQSIYVGTIGIGPVNYLKPALNTTPSIETLIPDLLNIKNSNANSICLEVSSHALNQQRLLNLPIKTAVFTNLSHEHLDYHGSMQAYAESKYSLFINYSIQNAVIYIGDRWGGELVKRLPEAVNYLTYGLSEGADIYPLSMNSTIEGIDMKLMTPQGELTLKCDLIGDFNALNLMAVTAVLMFDGWTLKKIKPALSQAFPICGRMEITRQSPTFIVDYAHTPDALEKALLALKPLCIGKLWCVFGCGGDRDPSKRALMGQVAQENSDRIVITNDNPRNESPLLIIEDIKQGLESSKEFDVILDRSKAIRFCFDNASVNDVILVAGKGHEDYQIIGSEKIFFSDQACIKNLDEVVDKGNI